MIRLSSSFTLAFALFFPVFWFVFFGCLTIFILSLAPEDLPIRNVTGFKSGLSAFFIFFAFLIYKFPMKLKRVEILDNQLYVTNYFKTITFPIYRVTKINERRFFRMKIVTLVLETKTFFGKKIRFLSDDQKMKMLRGRI
jgi:hypothetical protein